MREVVIDKIMNVMNTVFLMQFLGPEMLLVFFVILLLFGGKKIPELMRGLGKGVSEFNNARDSVTKEFKEGMREGDKEKIKIEENSTK
jgi:sec-independent protein translocase protein TatA